MPVSRVSPEPAVAVPFTAVIEGVVHETKLNNTASPNTTYQYAARSISTVVAS